jgi:23S rRNA (adenine2503-C2)-methyltransferase
MQTLPMAPTRLDSVLDASVNFVTEGDFPGAIEARYVRRQAEYFIVYLSSQTGCDKACRFCHLTQTGQTANIDVDLDGYLTQAEQVLAHYDTQPPARIVHYNFMSRGEVFANRCVLTQADELITALGAQATSRGLIPSFKFSTIMPRELAGRDLAKMFGAYQPDIYYSLYSLDPRFRRRWLPKAMDPIQALSTLRQYQRLSRKVIVLHWAFIAGENDDPTTIADIIETVNQIGLRVDVNIVRYNPYSERQGQEPELSVIEARAQQLQTGLPQSRIKIVGRVGFDVKASCGMFVAGSGAKHPAVTGMMPTQTDHVL